MDKDTLIQAVNFQKEIERYETLVKGLKRKLELLEKDTDRLPLKTQPYYNRYKEEILSIDIPIEVVEKVLRDKLYIESNRLKRYQLLFDRL